MLPILGLFAIAACISIIVYKLFFSFRKKHIGSGNIFYACTDGKFEETLISNPAHQDNLRVLMAKAEESTMIKDAILVHEFTNKASPYAHKILVSGMPVGYLSEITAEALQQEKISLGIHSGIIYSNVRMTKDKDQNISVALDLPPINQLAKVLSNRSFEDSLLKFSKFNLKKL